MKQYSERVEREFNEWKEIFDIPLQIEFEVKTLLALQEEYDNVKVGSDTTRTRETLLDMISKLKQNLHLVNKNKIPMYVDYGRSDYGSATIYYQNQIHKLAKVSQLQVAEWIKDFINKVDKYTPKKVYVNNIALSGQTIKDFLDEYKIDNGLLERQGDKNGRQ